MITEDFISFEIAKLLKEKGFDSECDYLYVNGDIVRAQGGKHNWNKGETIFTDYKNECSAPTLQMVMKWLREIYKLNIEIDTIGQKFLDTLSWRGIVHNLEYDTEYYYKDDFKSYEQACESAIKYCLENLI